MNFFARCGMLVKTKAFFSFYSAQVEKHKTSTRVLKTHRRKASFVKRGEAETS